MAKISFDISSAPSTDGGFTVVPAGWYSVRVADSEVRETASGTGAYLQLKLQIVGGPQDSMVVYDRLNLWNQSAKAVEIARGQLASLCHAVGRTEGMLEDSSELHGKVADALVAVRPASGQYGESNEIKKYRKGSSAQPPAGGATVTQMPPRQPESSAAPTPPWQR